MVVQRVTTDMVSSNLLDDERQLSKVFFIPARNRRATECLGSRDDCIESTLVERQVDLKGFATEMVEVNADFSVYAHDIVPLR